MQPIRFRSSEPPISIRATITAPELRGERRLCFYAAIFNVETVITSEGPAFREVIRPGAFASAIAARDPVYACVDHQRSTAFSDLDTGLMLQEDARGLFCSCYLGDTPNANAVLNDVKAGRLPGCSFAFRTVREQRTQQAGALPLVEVLQVRLTDVCLTNKPAYGGTVVSVRSNLNKHRDRRLQLLKLQTNR
jgi:HK97 family phage prohead protease